MPPFTLGICLRLYSVLVFDCGLRCTKITSPVATASVIFLGLLPTSPFARGLAAHTISEIFSVPFWAALAASLSAGSSDLASVSSSTNPICATLSFASRTSPTRQFPMSLGASNSDSRFFQSSKLSNFDSGPR